MKSEQEVFLGRQPILDRKQELFAFELLFRNGDMANANVVDNTIASSTVIVQLFGDFGFEEALGQYLGFVNVGRMLLLSDVVELLPRDKIVLEILETVPSDPEIVERVRALKSSGFTIALDDLVEIDDRARAWLPLIDIVKIDVAAVEPGRLELLCRQLRQWPVKLLAEKVDSREQVDICMALGFEYFQGYFFARPTIMRGKRLSSSEIALTRLLGLVMSDADTSEIEAAIKEQPIVTMKLMRLINSVATGLQREVSSVRQAVQVLGRRQLLRWLQLMVFSVSAPGSANSSPLLQLAAVRGKMMERLASQGFGSSAEVEDRAFITGIMSLMDAVFGMPIDQILDTLPVAPLVRSALVGREGDLGKLLSLVEAVEQYEILKVGELLESMPGLDLQAVNEAQTAALSWGNRVAQERPR